MDMFERATRQKYRFQIANGKVGVEDLWDLQLTQLDAVAKGLHRQLRNDDDVSFVDKDRKSDPKLQSMFDVVRHVIDVKLAERDAARSAMELAAREQQLLSVLAERQDSELKNKPTDEIQRQLEDVRKAKAALKAA